MLKNLIATLFKSENNDRAEYKIQMLGSIAKMFIVIQTIPTIYQLIEFNYIKFTFSLFVLSLFITVYIALRYKKINIFALVSFIIIPLFYIFFSIFVENVLVFLIIPLVIGMYIYPTRIMIPLVVMNLVAVLILYLSRFDLFQNSLQVTVGVSIILICFVMYRALRYNEKTEELNRKDINQTARKFSTIFERSPLGIALIDGNNKYVDVNNKLCEVLGYSKEELMKKDFVEITYIEDRAGNVKSFKRLFTGKIKSFNLEKRYVKKNGKVLWVDVIANLIEDENGKPLYCLSIIEDVSDSKRIQIALSESEKRYKQLIETAPIGIAVHMDGGIVFTNKEAAKILGAKNPNILIGKSIMDFVHDDYKALVKERFAEYGSSGPVPVYEDKYVRLDGTTIDVQVVGVPVQYNGKSAVQIVFNDISDRKSYENNLLIYKSAVESINEGIVITDPNKEDNPAIYCNKAFELITGYSSKEVNGKNLRMLLGPKTDMRIYKEINESIKRNEGITTQVINYKKDGSPFWNQLTIVPIKNEENDLTYFLGVLVDISDVRKSKQAIVKSKERWKSLVKNTPSLIMTTDLNFKITFINQKLENKMASKESVLDFIPEAHREEVKKIYNEVLKTGTSANYIMESVGPDGIKRWYSTIVGPIQNKSDIIGLLINATDITDQKKIQNDLMLAKESAEESRHVKEELLANVSHEMRTPMNVIIGMTELVKDTNLNSDQQQFVSAIKQSADHLLILIEDILDLSRLEAGMMKIHKVTFSLRELIDEVILKYKLDADHKNIALKKYIKNDVPEYFMGDKFRINQVLSNLLGNAVKFTDKGKVQIKVEGTEVKNNYFNIVFEIRDSGIGIALEDQQIIFESFTQALPASERRRGGTGLGLSIVKRLVELMQGEIKVYSKIGEGSTFVVSITLPIQTLEKKPKGQKRSDKNKFRFANKYKVLLAEDNNLNRLIIIRLLEKWNIDLVCVTNGAEVIKEIENTDFDLVLMDIRMPIVDGFEATKLIRNINNKLKSNVPIIALTAHSFKGGNEFLRKKGFNDYIQKPFNSDALFEKISSYLNK